MAEFGKLLLFWAFLVVAASGTRAASEADKDYILPAWVDSYGAPAAKIQLYFDGLKVKEGKQYPINATQIKPLVSISGSAIQKGHFYTLLEVDPDGPSPRAPTLGAILHWIVTNIPGSSYKKKDITSVGNEIALYLGPAPPKGVHRYTFLLFSQGTKKINVDIPNVNSVSGRIVFSSRNFTQTYNLGYPLGGTLFRAKAGH